MFKKVFLILLVAAFVLAGGSPVFAQARYGLTPSNVIETDTALAVAADSWVYELHLYADASNSSASLHDVATVAACSMANAVDDIGEATQYDDTVHILEKPVFLDNGGTVKMTTGQLIIFTGPAPTN